MFLNSLRDVSIPLFVCLSGALLICKKDSLAVFIKKRFISVVIPYVFWLIIFIIAEMIIFNINDPVNFIYKTISLPPTGHGTFLWFVQMILVVYAVIFILNKLNDYNKSFLDVSLIVSIVFLILINLNIIPMYPEPYRHVYFSIFAVFGYYLATYDFSSTKSLRISNEKLAAMFFILSILLYICEIYFNASASISLNSYSPISKFSFLNIALVISVFLFFRYAFESKGNFNKLFNYISDGKLGEIIFSIGFCSYGIFLCHIMVRDFLKHIINLKVYFSPSIYTTLLLFATLICSWLLILMMSKVPVLKIVSGNNKKS